MDFLTPSGPPRGPASFQVCLAPPLHRSPSLADVLPLAGGAAESRLPVLPSFFLLSSLPRDSSGISLAPDLPSRSSASTDSPSCRSGPQLCPVAPLVALRDCVAIPLPLGVSSLVRADSPSFPGSFPSLATSGVVSSFEPGRDGFRLAGSVRCAPRSAFWSRISCAS